MHKVSYVQQFIIEEDATRHVFPVDMPVKTSFELVNFFALDTT